MIFVKYNKYGVLETLDLQEETIFKGNNKINQVFVYFDDLYLKNTYYLTYAALVNSNDYEGNLTDLATTRTTYNYNGVDYDGFTFYLFSNLTAKAGTLNLSVRLVDRNNEEILVSGMLSLIVQETAISTYSSVNITLTQYEAILTALDDLSQQIETPELKTINDETLFGLGNISLPTFNYVDQRIDTLELTLNEEIEILKATNEELETKVENHEKRIKQLELASEGNILNTETSSGKAYELTVEEGILPYATIDKIGGMTYKSENLLVFDDVAETTTNGITYSIKDGIIYANGTNSSSSTIFVNFNLKKDLVLNGTYSNSWFVNGDGLTSDGSNQLRYHLVEGGVSFPSNSSTQTNTLTATINTFALRVASGGTINITTKPMLVSGSTIPTEFKQGFIGLRDSAVSQIISSGGNLLDLNLLIPSDGTFTKQSDNSYISKALGSYGSAYFNSTWSSSLSSMVSSNGISLNAGTYYISFKAKLNSGTSNSGIGTAINLLKSKQLSTTAVLNPTLTSNYQEYKRTFTLSTDDEVGISLQVGSGASNAVIQIKDIMIAKEDIDYKPYRGVITTKAIPTSIQNLDGYGVGVDSTYHNYVDFENKKFVKKVQKVVSSSNENFRVYATNTNGNVEITIGNVNSDLSYNDRYKTIASTNINNALINGYNNTTTSFVPTQSGNYLLINKTLLPNVDNYTLNSEAQKQYILDALGVSEIIAEYVFVLATPIETDISAYLEDEFIEVEEGGTLTFDNQYQNEVNYTWTYQQKI